MAANAADGLGFRPIRGMESYPNGFPALLVALQWLGLGTSPAIVLMNVMFLAMGLACSYGVLRLGLDLSPRLAALACLLAALSWLMVKHVTLALTDVPYFGLSAAAMLAMLAAYKSASRRRWAYLLVALLACAAAIGVRNVGVVLAPAFLYAAFFPAPVRAWLWRAIRTRPRTATAAGAALLTLLVIGYLAAQNTVNFLYVTDTLRRRGVVSTLATSAFIHIQELGVATLNAPSAQLPAWLWPVYVGAGALSLVLIGLGVRARKLAIGPMEVYLATYAGLLLVWPYADPRLLLPFLPFLFGPAILGVVSWLRRRPSGVALGLAWGHLLGYTALGVLALGWSTRLTFSGRRFPELYGNLSYRMSYRVALGSDLPIDAAEVHPDVVSLIRRYEPRALPAVVEPPSGAGRATSPSTSADPVLSDPPPR